MICNNYIIAGFGVVNDLVVIDQKVLESFIAVCPENDAVLVEATDNSLMLERG